MANAEEIASIADEGANSRLHTLRRWVTPRTLGAAELADSTLINTQLWVDQALWRPVGLWAALAGLLATGALAQPGQLEWKTVVLTLVLVELFWGAVWRLAGGRVVLLPIANVARNARVWLPYLKADSPATRLLAAERTDIWPYMLRSGLPPVVIAFAVAAVLGNSALLLTTVLVIVTILAWTLRRTLGGLPAILHSVAAVTLPWLIATTLFAPTWDERAWIIVLALIGLWTVHHWGATRCLLFGYDIPGLALMGVAQFGICILLVFAQAPLQLVFVVILFLPTWLAAFQRMPFWRLRILWLAAMLTSALALGQTL